MIPFNSKKSLFQNLINCIFIIFIFSSCTNKNIKSETSTTSELPVNTNIASESKENITQDSSVEKNKSKKKKSIKATQADNSDAKEITPKSESVCKSNSDERKLLISTVNQGCKLDYIKNNETKTVATQIIGDKKCEDVFNSIKSKLVAANFNCN